MNLTWLYVAVAYALAVWLARRGAPVVPWRVAFFFYAVVLVFLWPVLTQDSVSFAVDCLKGLPPWTYLQREFYVVNGELNDLPLQVVPWAHQVRESWRSLTLPLWNHLAGSGYPLLANGQSQAFSVVRILALPLSLGHAMSAEAAMKLLIAMTFMWLYCRGRKYSEAGSLIAAVSFGFSGFLVCWLHFAHTTVACLAPAALYAIDRLAERQTYGRLVFAAILGMVIAFGGHPETAAHLSLIGVAYALWIALVERPADLDRRRFLKSLAGAGGVAILLSAPYLAVLLEALPHSMRFHELKESPLSSYVGHGEWRSAILMLQPHFFGQVPFDRTWGTAHAESLGGYAGVLGAVSALALLVRVIATRNWRTREAFFLIATLFVAGAISNWPVFRHIFHLILPLAANARIRLLLVLLVSILTAAAIDKCRRELLIGILAVATLLLILLHVVDFPAAYWRDTAVLAMLPSLGVLALAAAATITRREEMLPLLLAAVVVELASWGRNFNPAVTERLVYPRTPLIEALDRLRAKQPPTDPARMAALGGVLYPNTQAVFGFEDIRFHDPMANRRYADFLANAAGLETKGRYHPMWEPQSDKSALDVLNVRYVIGYADTQVANPAHLRLVHEGRDGRIFENDNVLPRFFAVRNVILDYDKQSFPLRLQRHEGWSHTALLDWLDVENQQMHDDFFRPRPADSPIAKARIVAASPTDYRIRVSAPRYSLVASSVPRWPGWKITRNGRRIDPIRVNGAFLGFAVPKGEWDVRVWYSPWTFRLGAALSLLTALALFVVRRRGFVTY